MQTALIALVSTGLVFAVLDACWLGFMSERLYRPQMGALMRESTAWGPALMFYAIYVAALTFLIVLPAVERGAASSALLRGAVFGLAAYATYNFTNLATTRGWPTQLALIDNLWGTVATGLAAWAATAITLRLTGA